MLSDPMKGISEQGADFFGGRLEMREPAEVRELADGPTLDLAGLTLTVDHTPGHTRGSVVFHSELEEGGRVMFAGDTLFAGSIGRTDLPGGDMRTMTETLRTKILPLADDTVVLPGPRQQHHHRPRAREQPVPPGAGPQRDRSGQGNVT